MADDIGTNVNVPVANSYRIYSLGRIVFPFCPTRSGGELVRPLGAKLVATNPYIPNLYKSEMNSFWRDRDQYDLVMVNVMLHYRDLMILDAKSQINKTLYSKNYKNQSHQ